MRKAIRGVILLLLTVALSGCASLKGPNFELNQPIGMQDSTPDLIGKYILGRLSPQDIVKMKEDGHLDTTNLLADIAGFEPERATRLSCYSQAPDAILKYNAVPIAFWIVDLGYRKKIMNGLHSLHGGDRFAVSDRRTRLAALISESIKEPSRDWQTGFLIHALGDSFAHVKGGGVGFESAEAYGEFVGHGLSLKDPDEIFAEKNHVKYTAYTQALLQALGRANGDSMKKLAAYNAGVELIASQGGGNPAKLRAWMKESSRSSINKDVCKAHYEALPEKEVAAFLGGLLTNLTEKK